MTINDIVRMSIEDRACGLVGDMPWVTENLSGEQINDLAMQIGSSMKAAVLQEREECAVMAEMLIRIWGETRRSECEAFARLIRARYKKHPSGISTENDTDR